VLKRGKNRFFFLGLCFCLWYGVHDFVASRLEVYLNRGVSFGWMLPNWLWWSFFLFLSLLILGCLIKTRFWVAAGGCLVGGGINGLDRLRIGAVRDYFDFFGLFYNNLADWLIFGSTLVGIYLFLNERKNESRKNI
jgi:lipoprotein signal peptidase